MFQKFFGWFEGLTNGFVEGYRPVICIDASVLKTFLGSTLLSAVEIGRNNQMFPLAGAVVEGENNESWEWFLTNVRASLGGTMGSGLTIISDQHKALHILCNFMCFVLLHKFGNNVYFSYFLSGNHPCCYCYASKFWAQKLCQTYLCKLA